MVSAAAFLAFDVLTILISAADVITDVFVLYQWYINEHWAYFYISLSILILANISYLILYMRYIQEDAHLYCCGQFFWFIIGLIITPFLPYLIYLYETPHMCACFTKHIRSIMNCWWGNVADARQLQNALSQLNEYNFDAVFKNILKDKINCHLGFILETFLESFPQSIIQMIAILQLSSTNDTTSNVIIVSSILLSLLSIAFKSIMLLAVADLATSIFNWTATIIDFFAVFVITSWLFLEIPGNDTITKTINLQYFTLGLAALTTVPFVTAFFGCIYFSSYDQDTPSIYGWHSKCKICCLYTAYRCSACCFVLVFIIMWPFAVIAGHILCFVFVAFYIAKFGLARLKDTKDGSYWAAILRFIRHSADDRDALVKVLIVNYLYPINFIGDEEAHMFKNWLEKEANTAYKDVHNWAELRDHIHRDEFLKQVTFSNNSQVSNKWVVMFDKVISFVLLPWYLFGRCIHLLFPVCIYIINLGIFGIGRIYLLHHVLSLMFIGLLILIGCISWNVIYFTYEIYHIGYWNSPPPLNKDMFYDVEEYYIDQIQLPIIIDFFDAEFGEDVSKLIVEYLKCIQLD